MKYDLLVSKLGIHSNLIWSALTEVCNSLHLFSIALHTCRSQITVHNHKMRRWTSEIILLLSSSMVIESRSNPFGPQYTADEMNPFFCLLFASTQLISSADGEALILQTKRYTGVGDPFSVDSWYHARKSRHVRKVNSFLNSAQTKNLPLLASSSLVNKMEWKFILLLDFLRKTLCSFTWSSKSYQKSSFMP